MLFGLQLMVKTMWKKGFYFRTVLFSSLETLLSESHQNQFINIVCFFLIDIRNYSEIDRLNKLEIRKNRTKLIIYLVILLTFHSGSNNRFSIIAQYKPYNSLIEFVMDKNRLKKAFINCVGRGNNQGIFMKISHFYCNTYIFTIYKLTL